jgi:hypothetical protein
MFSIYLEFRTMGELHKPSLHEYSTPSLESATHNGVRLLSLCLAQLCEVCYTLLSLMLHAIIPSGCTVYIPFFPGLFLYLALWIL